MAPDDSQRSIAPSRRSLREAATAPSPQRPASARPASGRRASARSTTARPQALTWVSAETVTARPVAWPDGGAAVVEPPLVARWPRRSVWRAPLLVPLMTALVMATIYAVAMLMWPLHAVTPTIAAQEVTPVAAPAAVMPWPAQGSAAVSVAGISGSLASSPDAVTMASITKVIASLVILEEMPLALGEQGPSFSFSRQTAGDYLSRDESALRVPVGGSLTQYQLLEGTLIGSAGNYIDRLADALYPNDAVFARAAMQWLDAHGITGITIADPSGIGVRNTATPEDLLAVARLAMAHPVIAEIVGKTSVDLPGAGLVENTNRLLADPGVVGIKTGMLNDAYNVLLAKDIVVGETTVRVYADVLHQSDPDTRSAIARQLFAALEEQLQPTTTVAQGTVVGTVTTEWGESVDVVAAADADLILWNASPATAVATLQLGEARVAGADVGTVAVTGPLGSAAVAAELAADIEPPSPWWRLTHPLELLGLR